LLKQFETTWQRGANHGQKPTNKNQPSNVIDLRAAREAASSFGRNFWHRLVSAQSLVFYALGSVVVLLASFGLVMVLSASYADQLEKNGNWFGAVLTQALAIVPGIVMMAILSITPLEWLRRRAGAILVAALGFQLLTASSLGSSVNGNRNWIHIGALSVQPSEFLKLAMIVALSGYLYRNEGNFDNPKTWWKSLGIPLFSMVAVMAGLDLGTVIVMSLITFAILGLAGMPRRIMGALTIAGSIAFLLAVRSSASRLARFTVWMFPDSPDPFDLRWQPQHGLWALAAGGVGGVGLGNSKLKWSWIPEAQNDFIFAIIGEEEGLIGAVLVLALFIVMGFLFRRIALRTVDIYSRSIVIGIGVWLVGQAMINIAVVLNLLPVLGVPLPLISAGGSSLLANLMAVGLVLAIERENQARGDLPIRRAPRVTATRRTVSSKR